MPALVRADPISADAVVYEDTYPIDAALQRAKRTPWLSRMANHPRLERFRAGRQTRVLVIEIERLEVRHTLLNPVAEIAALGQMPFPGTAPVPDPLPPDTGIVLTCFLSGAHGRSERSVGAAPDEDVDVPPGLIPRFEGEAVSSRMTDIKKSRFNEAQIIGMLREQEAGSLTAEVSRRQGISA